MQRCDRRRFLKLSLEGAAVAAFPWAGCGARKEKAGGGVPPEGYPLVAAAGSHRAIGRMIGSAMKERIGGFLRLSPEFDDCARFARGDGAPAVATWLGHARDRFPRLVEEVEGMAEGIDVPFLSLFAYNCRSEIHASRESPGCSTIALRREGRMILAHNEDGGDGNVGRMFLARVSPPSGVDFLSFVYPGLLPGNGPGFNAAGIVQTTNYICPRNLGDGVPRYFVGRAVMEASSLDEAVALAATEPRAFPWHHNLASLREGRILSVETIAEPAPAVSVIEVDGVRVHTNHLIHPAMTGGEGANAHPYDRPYESSRIRMEVLSRAIDENGPPASADEMIELLSLHEGHPYSPCRHPEGEIHGATLAAALFRSPRLAMTLFHGNPCRNLRKVHTIEA